jgi:hypothetical protein
MRGKKFPDEQLYLAQIKNTARPSELLKENFNIILIDLKESSPPEHSRRDCQHVARPNSRLMCITGLAPLPGCGFQVGSFQG